MKVDDKVITEIGGMYESFTDDTDENQNELLLSRSLPFFTVVYIKFLFLEWFNTNTYTSNRHWWLKSFYETS